MRKDAQARRDRLIAAAADLFEQHGYGVALEAVAERARVGRGTLYRNFVDRNAMIVAVLETRLDELAKFVRENIDSSTLFSDFIRQQGVAAAFHAKALVGTQSGTLDQIVTVLRKRADTLLETVLDRAAASGSISPHITITDMRIVNAMLIAAATMPGVGHAHGLERALAILLAGLDEERTGA